MTKSWSSPNHGDRKGHDISMLVLHYTGMKSAEEALSRLCDPQAEVSAHYLIDEDGSSHALVPEDRRAWHAGVGGWSGDDDINSVSIGIELVNPGHEWGYRAFPPKQIDALVVLMRSILQRHTVPLNRIVGHSDVAPGRKKDPGELFPWAELVSQGLAVAPWSGRIPSAPLPPDDAPDALAAIGYRVDRFGFEPCLEAFQRRFAPSELGKGLTTGTRAALSEASTLMA